MFLSMFTLTSFLLIWPSGQISICNWAVMSSSLALVSMYSAPGHMVNANEFIYGTHFGILPPIDGHQVILASGLYMAFEGHIFCCHIFCSSMVNKCSRLLIFD